MNYSLNISTLLPNYVDFSIIPTSDFRHVYVTITIVVFCLLEQNVCSNKSMNVFNSVTYNTLFQILNCNIIDDIKPSSIIRDFKFSLALVSIDELILSLLPIH